MHNLLESQILKATDTSGIINQAALVNLINSAYEEFDHSLQLQNRATQRMADELTDLNASLRKERDETVAEQQKRFELAVEGTNDGIWDWDVASDSVWFSPRCKAMLGYTGKQLSDTHIDDWYNLVHPEDVAKARKLIEEHLKWRMRGAATLRFKHVNGEVRYIMYRATTLQDSTGKVARIVGVHTDITDLIVMQEELKAARDRAERANKAKSEFLANMSHELRTPMHAILGFSRLAHKRSAGVNDEKLSSMLNNIGVSGNRLLTLLNDLLDLSKLESGRTSFEYKTDDLRKAIDQTLAEIESISSAKQITIAVKAENARSILAYDYKFMLQVFMNLLSNAIKFSPPSSEITLRLTETETRQGKPALLCSVEDQGVGIPEGELELVFDKFVQSSKTRSTAGGTGLGLAIVREIVEAHGGKIWAENLPVTGANFKMLLPYDQTSHLLMNVAS